MLNMSQAVTFFVSSTHDDHTNDAADNENDALPNDNAITIPWQTTPAAQERQHHDGHRP
jgi:hypothetical protein